MSHGFRLLPIQESLEGYNLNAFRKDFNAGLNVSLLAFPQGMAFALIAGLPIQYGIFGAAVSGLIGPLFTNSRFLSLGPTNATSVMLMGAFISMSATPERIQVLLPVILMLVGVFLIAGYLIKAANLIQYVSTSVITGYITAAALLIISNQLKNALGFHFNESAPTFFAIIEKTFIHLRETQWTSLLMALATLGFFLLLKSRFKNLPNVALTLIIMSIVGYFLNQQVDASLQIETFPSYRASDWRMTIPSLDLSLISEVGSVAMALCFLTLLEGVSIGKSLAARSGESIDPNLEMLSLGVANLSCAFFSGMPSSGSLTRSTLNWSSNAVTPVSSLVKGVLCAIGALALGPFIHYVPKASLAVLVIYLGFSLVHFSHIRIMLKTTQRDRIVFLVTLLSAMVFRLDTAIFMGTGISIILFLRKAAMPELVEYTYGETGQLTELPEGKKRRNPQVSIVHVEGNLFFGAAELFRSQMRRICMEPDLKVVILKMRNALYLDATAALALEELIRYMEDFGRHLLISEIKPEVLRIFKATGILDVIKEENIFLDDPENPMLSTAKAAARAREIVGSQGGEVSIQA